VPDGSQWLVSGTLYSKNMLISGKNRAVASTYFKADATAPFFSHVPAMEHLRLSRTRSERAFGNMPYRFRGDADAGCID